MRLEPMSPIEFESFLEVSCVGFAMNSPTYSGIEISKASDDVKTHFLSKIAPNGLRTKGHYFLNIYFENMKIGYFHFGELPSQLNSRQIFAWDFQIFENWRGQKLARRAMKAAEEFLLSKGYTEIGLNVFASNNIAISLYESMGFAPVQINMSRKIGQ